MTKEKEYNLKYMKELVSNTRDSKQFQGNVKKFTEKNKQTKQNKNRQVGDISDEQWFEHRKKKKKCWT